MPQHGSSTSTPSPVGLAELVHEEPVAIRDHTLHDLRRVVPHAELPPQVRVEGGEERLVEVLDRHARVERLEEGDAVDPVEHVGRVAQGVPQARLFQDRPACRGVVQPVDDGHREVGRGHRVGEGVRAPSVLLVPQHPRGEEAVEQGLHELRPEKGVALRRRELDAERALQRRLEALQIVEAALFVEPRFGVPSVRGEEERQLARRLDGGLRPQRAAQELLQGTLVRPHVGLRHREEGGLVLREHVPFDDRRLSVAHLHHRELAQVGEEHLPVPH